MSVKLKRSSKVVSMAEVKRKVIEAKYIAFYGTTYDAIKREAVK